jgi:large subunit ribosomal protein L9
MANVKLILKEDVSGLGHAGDVVSVKPGYAKNFLVPEGKATVASEAKIREVEHLKRQIAEKVAKQLSDLKKAKKALEALDLEVKAKAGEEGKLFGSVTAAQVAELIAARGIEIDRRKVELPEPIKELGEHSVSVRLHREVTATLRLKVTAEE